MTKHTTLKDVFDTLINSSTASLYELLIDETTYYGIVLADKTAIVPFGDFYELYSPDEYVIKSEVTPC